MTIDNNVVWYFFNISLYPLEAPPGHQNFNQSQDLLECFCNSKLENIDRFLENIVALILQIFSGSYNFCEFIFGEELYFILEFSHKEVC